MDANEKKVMDMAAKLAAEHSTGELAAMYQQAFGVATKRKDKSRLAEKIARHVVEGDNKADVEGDGDGGGEVKASPEEELSACAALARIKNAWDEFEALNETKKTQMAELRQTIVKAREAVGEVLQDDKLDDKKKLVRIEGHWRTITRTEEKKTALAKEFRDKMKDSKQAIKHEIGNVRQLPLSFGS